MKKNKNRNGFKIVLTAGRAVMSESFGEIGPSFVSAFPPKYLPNPFIKWVFPLKSEKGGRLKRAQYGLCKVEASLLKYGFSSDDVAIVDPTKLDIAIGPATKVVGIGCLDPLALSFGTKIAQCLLHCLHLSASDSIMAKTFREVLFNPVLRKFRSNGLKVIIGGQGVWQLIDSGVQNIYGIDCIVEGEGESVVGPLFEKAVKGEKLPKLVHGLPVEVQDIPLIRTPSRSGMIEVTRGCDRGCRFCNPATHKFRSIPKQKILNEIKFNIASGIQKVSIHSDDFFRYGSKGRDLNPAAILDLLNCVKQITSGLGKNSFNFDFISAASIMQAPDLIEDVSELMQLGKKNQSIVAVGVETGSPRLLTKHMPGKVKPFKIEDWPEIILSAAKILHDNNWTVFYSFILGLPEETSDDLMKTLELVDQLKGFNCILMPIIFIPIARLRKQYKSAHSKRDGDFSFENMTKEHWLVFTSCMEHTIKNLGMFTSGYKNITAKIVRKAILPYLPYPIKKIRENLKEKYEK